VLIAVFLSVVIENIMMERGLIFLTFPFVLATWLTLIIRDVLVKKVFAQA
jgi:urea transporter